MAKPRQSSFRRILFSRILLLSIPVLLAGEYVAYRKARSGLLDTARHNLTSSAVRKGETILDLTEALRSNLVSASDAFSTQVDQPQQAQDFITRMARSLPRGVQCVQLTNMQTGQLEASTCGKQPISQGLDNLWSNQSQTILDPRSSIRISQVSSGTSSKQATPLRQLDLVFQAPVYDSFGQLRYAVSVQTALHRQETSQPGSLAGYTVVIDQDGTILAHPRKEQIGKNIRDEASGGVLQEVLTKSIAGSQDFFHLFNFDPESEEWLAAYTPIEITLKPGETRTWTVMAVAPIRNALYSLEEVKQILVVLTLGLVAANLLAAIYISRELARPLEKLGDYALQIYQRRPSAQAPKDFKIRELNQLGAALDNMVHRLEERAEELETAWQEAQIANQLKSEFLATTSHELRTPLNGIIGCLRLVKDGCCDSHEEELEFLQQADDAAIHLLKIINDLLDIAKIEAGKVELNLQSVSIYDLCRQCLRMVQTGAERKQLSLTFEVEDHLDRIPLDERRVRQMVINLLSNAVKFTPEGGQVRLTARAGYGHELEQDVRPDHSPVNPSTTYLCLEVKDSGIGIPEDRWHLLFRPFQQVDSSLTRRHEGTGLGLALTKRLAELHGGTLSFQSSPDHGSVFRIWLPSPEAAPIVEEIASTASVNGSKDSESVNGNAPPASNGTSNGDTPNGNAAETPNQLDTADPSISMN